MVTVKGTAKTGKDASGRHQLNLNTPLPPQKLILTVTESKVQFISIFNTMYINEHAELLPRYALRLVITGLNPPLTMIYEGNVMERAVPRTTHKESDVIVMYQVVHLATGSSKHPDDTDISVLLHFIALEMQDCHGCNQPWNVMN